MKKKIVLKVQISCDKCRKKALEITASAEGVASIAVQGADKDQLVVTGEGIDAPSLTETLRKKVGWTDIVTIEEVKEEKKKEEKKKEEEKKNEIKVVDLCPCKNPYCMQCPPTAVYTVDYDPQPICSIM
ncbi:hypothetical protein QJS10_CPB15g01136 [Acorus calamus]|uniref:HMA domain-containing protein n=1 Tax=Acorus calamus TaxID=4465 RepID=A0AAV9D5A2_ACOCL|nr:hypothetical protein QJS10_CPB15g01136 [Acorus calamus]